MFSKFVVRGAISMPD